MEDPQQQMNIKGPLIPFLIACAVGVLVAGPFFIASQSGAPLPGLVNDQDFYLARIQDVREGHPMSGNAYLKEGKDALPMQFLTGEVVEAGVLDLLGLPTVASLTLFGFLFPIIIFLITYGITRMLGAPLMWGLIAALFLTVGTHFHSLMRPISPQFNFIFWLLAVWSVFSLSVRPTRVRALLVALAIGVLFYLYPYYWTHLLAATGLLLVFLLVKERGAVASLAGAMVGAVVVGIGYVALALTAHRLPEYAESMSRLGFIETHTPSGVALAAATAVVLALVGALLYRANIFPRTLWAPLALVVGGLAAMNQHVVTGINMEFSSHYQMQIIYATTFLVVAVVTALGEWQRVTRPLTTLAATVVVLAMSYTSITAVYREIPTLVVQHIEERAVVTALATLPAGVVYGPELVTLMVPPYTEHDVFTARNANIAFIGNDEVADRFILQYFDHTIDAAFVGAHEREIFGHHYINRYQHALQKQKFLKFIGIHTELPERVPTDRIQELAVRAGELQSQSFKEAASPYQIDYLVIDTRSPALPQSVTAQLPRLMTVGPFEVFEYE